MSATLLPVPLEAESLMGPKYIISPENWSERAKSILLHLHSIPAPRTQLELDIKQHKSIPRATMKDHAQNLFAEIYRAHRDLQPKTDSPMAQFTTWLAINSLFDIKTRSPAPTSDRMWFDNPQHELFGHLADILEKKPDLLHPSFPALDVKSHPTIPALSSIAPPSFAHLTPPHRTQTKASKSLATGDVTEAVGMWAETGAEEDQRLLKAENRVETQDITPDMQGDDSGASFVHPMHWANAIPPIKSLESVPDTTAQAIDMIKVRASAMMQAKNGVSASTAEKYLDAVLLESGIAEWSLDELCVLLCFKFTAETAPLFARLPTSRVRFNIAPPYHADDNRSGWGYYKTFSVSVSSLAAMGTKSRNPFTKRRFGDIVRDLRDKGNVRDPIAAAILQEQKIRVSTSPVILTPSQAGLLAGLPRDRLKLESREMRDVKNDPAAKYRTWVEGVWRGPGMAGGISDYHPVVQYWKVQDRLGVDVYTARLAVELAIFGIFAGPTNLNIIALGDQGKMSLDYAPLKDALKKAGFDTRDGEGGMTLALLHEAGYKGGDPWAWLQNSSQRRVRVVEFGADVDIKTWYPRPDQRCLGTTLVLADMSGPPNTISLVPLLDHHDHFTKKIFLSSSVAESTFNSKTEKYLSVRIVPHPFIINQFAMTTAAPLSSGLPDYWRATTTLNRSFMVEGEGQGKGCIRVLRLGASVTDGAEKARKLLGLSVEKAATATSERSVDTTLPTPFVMPPKNWAPVLSDYGRRLPVLYDNMRLIGEYSDPADSRLVVEKARVLHLLESGSAVPHLVEQLTGLYEACLVIAVRHISKDAPGSRCAGQTHDLHEEIMRLDRVVTMLDTHFAGWSEGNMPVPAELWQDSVNAVQQAGDAFHLAAKPTPLP